MIALAPHIADQFSPTCRVKSIRSTICKKVDFGVDCQLFAAKLAAFSL